MVCNSKGTIQTEDCFQKRDPKIIIESVKAEVIGGVRELTNIITVIKQIIYKMFGACSTYGKKRYAYKSLVGKPEGLRTRERHTNLCKMILKRIAEI
jgi:hypothetical protein